MKASTLIKRLNETIEKHGDCVVYAVDLPAGAVTTIAQNGFPVHHKDAHGKTLIIIDPK